MKRYLYYLLPVSFVISSVDFITCRSTYLNHLEINGLMEFLRGEKSLSAPVIM